MILTLYTEEYFNSAHLLEGYDGKCSQIHGHTWKISVWIKGDENKKNKIGILWDFNNLNKLVNKLDHKYLNDVMKKNPTVENITIYIYNIFKNEHPDLDFKIRIYESIIKKEAYCEAGDF